MKLIIKLAILSLFRSVRSNKWLLNHLSTQKRLHWWADCCIQSWKAIENSNVIRLLLLEDLQIFVFGSLLHIFRVAVAAKKFQILLCLATISLPLEPIAPTISNILFPKVAKPILMRNNAKRGCRKVKNWTSADDIARPSWIKNGPLKINLLR